MTPWYDTEAGIQRAIDKGLAGLHELKNARREAGYDRKERLDQWVLLGLYALDTCGNFMTIVENAPRSRRAWVEVPDIMTRDEAIGRGLHSFSSTIAPLPPIVEVCDRCLRGWDMYNLGDFHIPHRHDDPPRHKRCHKLYVVENEQAYFRGLLDASEIPYTEMRAIPNEYHSGLYDNPWFIVETKYGPLRIGWRKRVISISWEAFTVNVNGSDLFRDEKVTKAHNYIHAWGKDKAFEYLQKLSKAATALAPESA